jgi:3-methyladenine DNA glycosylase AlkD
MTTPEQVARRAKRELARLSRPAGAFDAGRYFRGPHGLGFYNTGTQVVRHLARQIYRERRQQWSVDDAMRCADVLIRDRHLEVKGLAIELVALYRHDFIPALLPKWKRWLASGHSSNWATTDAICGYLIGPLVLSHPALASTVARWAGHSCLWVRRAAAVGLIASVHGGAGLGLAYGVATRLRSDREDLIQKAVGWMLREAGKADPARLERYLLSGGAKIPRTTLRYAIERLPPAKRRVLLKATRR